MRPIRLRHFTHRCLTAGFLALGLSAPAAAAPVNFEITLGGAIGSFTADEAGGLLTSFSLMINGILFDTLGVGNAAPVYDALANDIRGVGSTSGFITNSLANATCGIGECVLDLEDSTDPGVIPPLYAIFPVVGGIPRSVIDSGAYAITKPGTTVVPLPATIWLMIGGLGGLLLARRNRA